MTDPELLEIFRKMSPSAPFDLRRRAIAWAEAQKPNALGEKPKWWDHYPDGTAAAFIFRMAYALGEASWFAPWEEPGHELPESLNRG